MSLYIFQPQLLLSHKVDNQIRCLKFRPHLSFNASPEGSCGVAAAHFQLAPPYWAALSVNLCGLAIGVLKALYPACGSTDVQSDEPREGQRRNSRWHGDPDPTPPVMQLVYVRLSVHVYCQMYHFPFTMDCYWTCPTLQFSGSWQNWVPNAWSLGISWSRTSHLPEPCITAGALSYILICHKIKV